MGKIAHFYLNDIGIHSSLKKFKGDSHADDFIVGMGNSAKEAYSSVYEKLTKFIKDNNITRSNVIDIRKAVRRANDELVVGIAIDIYFNKDGSYDSIDAETAMVGPPLAEKEKENGKLVVRGDVRSIGEFMTTFVDFFKSLKDEIKLEEFDVDAMTDEIRYIEDRNKNNKYVVILNVAYEDNFEENIIKQ